MSLAYPRSRRGRDSHWDEMAGVLEGVDEWVDVWGEAMGGGPIIVDNLSSQHSALYYWIFMKIWMPRNWSHFWNSPRYAWRGQWEDLFLGVGEEWNRIQMVRPGWDWIELNRTTEWQGGLPSLYTPLSRVIHDPVSLFFPRIAKTSRSSSWDGIEVGMLRWVVCYVLTGYLQYCAEI